MAIFDRGVNRHPSSLELWHEYLAYAAKVKATKRWRKVMTSALRMMPTNPELWVLAGRRSASHGDMSAARSFFMRGCRFCAREPTVWVEYARCELQWLSKIEAKSKGKNNAADALKAERTEDGDEIKFNDGNSDEEESGEEDMLPQPSNDTKPVFNVETTKTLQKHNPALDGAIPLAIFNISRKQTFFNADVAELFFDMVAEFNRLSVYAKISQHILDSMMEEYANAPATCNCYVRQPLIGVSPDVPEFPRGLKEGLARLRASLESTSDQKELARKTVGWIEVVLAVENLEENLRLVLERMKANLQQT
jgi:U3 small nucleolar RNA-associated protein 6